MRFGGGLSLGGEGLHVGIILRMRSMKRMDIIVESNYLNGYLLDFYIEAFPLYVNPR